MKKKLLFCLMAMLCICITASADKERSDMNMKYDIQSAGVGSQGTYLCKVTVYAKKPKDDDIIKAAVHGVIFKGVVGGNGVATKKPMANPSIEYQKADFFNTFFTDNGPYMSYATMDPSTVERTKMANKQYRVSAIVSVNKDALRQYLEQAGIVQSLGGMF